MGKFAIGLLTLAVYATALAVVPMVTPAAAATNGSRQIKKHKQKIRNSPGFSDPWSAGQARPVARPSGQAGGVCPGIARSFECGSGLLQWRMIPIERFPALMAARRI
jgi:hypothetical protein